MLERRAEYSQPCPLFTTPGWPKYKQGREHWPLVGGTAWPCATRQGVLRRPAQTIRAAHRGLLGRATWRERPRRATSVNPGDGRPLTAGCLKGLLGGGGRDERPELHKGEECRGGVALLLQRLPTVAAPELSL